MENENLLSPCEILALIKKLKEALPEFLGYHVAVRNGIVFDADTDIVELHKRVPLKQYSDGTCFLYLSKNEADEQEQHKLSHGCWK